MSSVYDALLKAGRKKSTVSAGTPEPQSTILERRIVIGFFAFLFLLIMNQVIARVLRAQMEESAAFITTNLGDAAASYLASKDMLQLKTTVAKYARLNRVAYVFIRDGNGQIIAESLPSLTAEVHQGSNYDQGRGLGRRQLTFEGKSVYETRGPILDGQLGTVHIGIWADIIERDIYHALFMYVWPLALGLFAAVILTGAAVRPLMHGLLRRLLDARWASHATSTEP
jgi:sensor histidine kinase regulating citrate/malate metabolism